MSALEEDGDNADIYCRTAHLMLRGTDNSNDTLEEAVELFSRGLEGMKELLFN